MTIEFTHTCQMLSHRSMTHVIFQVVVLLDKAARRKVDIQPDYCALAVSDTLL